MFVYRVFALHVGIANTLENSSYCIVNQTFRSTDSELNVGRLNVLDSLRSNLSTVCNFLITNHLHQRDYTWHVVCLRKIGNLTFKMKKLLILSLALFATAVKSHAFNINFDSVNAENGDVDATAYLASYGVTLTNVSNPGTVHIISDNNFYGSGVVIASSPHNFLMQNVGGSPNGISYTLNFSTGLTSLSFTRIAIPSFSAVAQWTATAYDGSTALGSVGENFSFGLTGAHTYTLSWLGMDITSLTITANGFNFAGISSAPLDDFIGTPAATPDAGSTLPLLGFASLGLVALRRKLGC